MSALPPRTSRPPRRGVRRRTTPEAARPPRRGTGGPAGWNRTRPGPARLAVFGAACAVACVAVAGAVAFAPVWSARNPASAPRGNQGAAPLNQVPPVPSRAAPSAHTSAIIQATPKTVHHWQAAVVHSTYVLNPGGSVRSNRLMLSLLTDGDLVLRDFDGRVTWSSGTRAQNTQAVFQADGNFVLYQGNATLWSTPTDGHNGATLVLGADGKMSIEYGGAKLWSTR